MVSKDLGSTHPGHSGTAPLPRPPLTMKDEPFIFALTGQAEGLHQLHLGGHRAGVTWGGGVRNIAETMADLQQRGPTPRQEGRAPCSDWPANSWRAETGSRTSEPTAQTPSQNQASPKGK